MYVYSRILSYSHGSTLALEDKDKDRDKDK